jgi:hypothetical protein
MYVSTSTRKPMLGCNIRQGQGYTYISIQDDISCRADEIILSAPYQLPLEFVIHVLRQHVP